MRYFILSLTLVLIPISLANSRADEPIVIAHAKTGACVTLIAGEKGKGQDVDILARSTSDGGATGSRPVEVEIRKRGGAMYLLRPSPTEAEKLDQNASGPVITSSPKRKS